MARRSLLYPRSFSPPLLVRVCSVHEPIAAKSKQRSQPRLSERFCHCSRRCLCCPSRAFAALAVSHRLPSAGIRGSVSSAQPPSHPAQRQQPTRQVALAIAHTICHHGHGRKSRYDSMTHKRHAHRSPVSRNMFACCALFVRCSRRRSPCQEMATALHSTLRARSKRKHQHGKFRNATIPRPRHACSCNSRRHRGSSSQLAE